MMKKIVYIFMIAVIMLPGCNRFLDITPRDIQVVSTVQDYRDVLASYMAFLTDIKRGQDKVLGDYFVYPHFDLSLPLWFYTGGGQVSSAATYYFDMNTGLFNTSGVRLQTWQMEQEQVWIRYYKFLGPINMIINGIETATGNDENMRNFVKGEALVWRAFSYFKLLQYYAPYKDNRYGIPVYLKPYEDPASAMPERKTQTEVYSQVLADCNKALELLEVTPANMWNMAYQESFIHSMMASVYAYKAMSGAADATDWAEAAKYASAAMKGRGLITTTSGLVEMFDCSPATGLKECENDEIFIRICKENETLFDFKTSYRQDVDYTKIGNIYQKFKEDDIRKNLCFKKLADGSICYDKYNTVSMMPYQVDRKGVLMPFRLAEAWLVKAEALVRQNKVGEARVVLEDFRAARYESPSAVPSDAEGVLNMILEEREIEFYQESDIRWLDMKRLGVKVERIVNGTNHVLEPDDFRYCFPIPKSELLSNKNMVQTPGWDKVIF